MQITTTHKKMERSCNWRNRCKI